MQPRRTPASTTLPLRPRLSSLWGARLVHLRHLVQLVLLLRLLRRLLLHEGAGHAQHCAHTICSRTSAGLRGAAICSRATVGSGTAAAGMRRAGHGAQGGEILRRRREIVVGCILEAAGTGIPISSAHEAQDTFSGCNGVKCWDRAPDARAVCCMDAKGGCSLKTEQARSAC